MRKTWMDKVQDRRNKENKIPAKPKGKSKEITVCPGCGQELGFTMIIGKGGFWVNGNWSATGYSHCLKFEI